MKNDFGIAAQREIFRDDKGYILLSIFLAVVFFLAEHDLIASLNGSGLESEEFIYRVEQGTLLRQIAFSALGLFGLVCLLKPRDGVRLRPNGVVGFALVAYVLWEFMSFFWSIDRGLAFRRLVLQAILWLSAIGISQRYYPLSITRWVFISSLAYLIIGIIAEASLGAFRPFSAAYRFSGTVNPNAQGIYCGLLFLSSLFLAKTTYKYRFFYINICIIAVICALATKSRNAIASVSMATLLFWWLGEKRMAVKYMVLCFCFAGFLTLVIMEFSIVQVKPAFLMGRADLSGDSIGSLTGRIPVWEEGIAFALKRPLWGYGYCSFWTPAKIRDISQDVGWVLESIHSSYIEMVLGLGMVGLGLFLVMSIGGVRRSLILENYSGSPFWGFAGTVILFFLFVGLLESIVLFSNQLSFLLMILLVNLGFSETRSKGRGYQRCSR